jgi:hypothetical protein
MWKPKKKNNEVILKTEEVLLATGKSEAEGL